ncbi:MAG: hypothetical protein JW910_10000, partial [Anaerolineae bacterium]|nr:hypothetical protein [Anaerolineae bacterium]
MSQQFYPLINDLMNAFAPHYQDAANAALREAGFFAGGGDWFRCFVVWGAGPDPVSVEALAQMFPYG